MSQLISNAFSLNMVEPRLVSRVRFMQLEMAVEHDRVVLRNPEGKKYYPERMESIVGHQGTADLLSSILNVTIVPNRVTVILNDEEDELVIGQYIGPRLEEGTTKLPENATINFVLMYYEQ